MKKLFTHRFSLGFALLAGSLVLAVSASAQPSNNPLLITPTGAKPNLMIALDNSGSMAYPYHEGYGLLYNDNNNNNLRFCPAPLRGYDPDNGWVTGGRVGIQGAAAGQNCIATNNTWTGGDVAYAPARVARNNMAAQRSADLNPVYYNPRTTYAPRLGPDYQPLPRPANPVFISNQTSTSRQSVNFYEVYRNPTNGATPVLYTVHRQKPAAAAPAWATATNLVYTLFSYPFPIHLEYNNNGSGATPTFYYTYCRDAAGNSTVEQDVDGKDIGCSSYRGTPFAASAAGSVVNVYAPGHPLAATNVIALPADHKRTDCGTGGTCTNAQELNNILNWYHWYSTRQAATSTAIGQSLAGSKFQNKLRIGYMPINDPFMAGSGVNTITQTPGTNTGNTSVLRGVRELQGNTPASTQLYTFLNTIASRGGTPLHNAINKVATYYSVPGSALENPAANNPAALGTGLTGSNPELTCRRSFNLLFSDGGWTQSYAPVAGPDYDNMDGPLISGTTPDGLTSLSYRYLRFGNDTPTGRKEYVPYPSPDTGGLADLTAQYYWFTDLSSLAGAAGNNRLTSPGNPTFWQNMTTYTVGYFVRPTGEARLDGVGLTFDRIDQYKAQYQNSGYAAATKPTWPTGNLVTNSTNQMRVDDFIHAGYTGGGRSFSARSSDDVRSIFDKILSEVIDTSGNDAGVASSGSGATAANTDSAKYEVTYRTMDNTGELSKIKVDPATRAEISTLWTGTQGIPAPASRNVFTFSEAGTPTPVSLSGNFSGLPSDVRNTIAQGPFASRVPTNASFVNYLRGDDNVVDANNKAFRKRSSKMGAVVNSPPLYVSGQLDYWLDDPNRNSDVQGKDYYQEYLYRKKGYPASVYVATNAGAMHAFDALAGTEMAAFMPRRGLKRALNYASDSYSFEYMLDGPISDNDVFDASRISPATPEAEKWKGWRQLAIGTGGRGEPLVYAINAPFQQNPGRRVPGQADFLWETGPDKVNASDGGAVQMGYPSNAVRTGQTEVFGQTDPDRGYWIAAVNNGHYNGQTDGSKAGLVVLNAKTGAVIRNIPLPGNYSAGRGLSGVTLVRSYETHVRVVAAYAGDANGNVWRFDLSGEPSTWHVTYGKPIFTVPNNRPIYGHPAWQPHPLGGFIVVFATGMALEDNDLNDLGAQSIYAVWDKTTVNNDLEPSFTTITDSQLLEQTVDQASAVVVDETEYFQISDNDIDWNIHRGWKMPLGWRLAGGVKIHLGERSVADTMNFSTSVIISTTVLQPRPATESQAMCMVSPVPGNYLYVLNALTGKRALSKSFDVDGDGKPDEYAVAYKRKGGFARGLTINYPPETVPDPANTNDPRLVVDLSTRLKTPYVEAHGESPRKTGNVNNEGGECEKREACVEGTPDCQPIFVSCKTGWSRTQYQLSRPPGVPAPN